MKNFIIILLFVVIIAITGCSKVNDNRNETSDINSTDSVSTVTKDKITGQTTVGKENKTTEANVGSETETKEIVTSEITINQTQYSTEGSAEVTTVPQIEENAKPQAGQSTENPTEQPIKATEPDTTAIKYDIASAEYQNQLKNLTIYYINQYRLSEGHVALTEDVGASAFAQARSVQLLTNFAHDVGATRALATEMKYGEYVDTKLYGMDGEPYYTPYGQEAIAKVFGNGYSSADDVAKRIAAGFYRSKEHWYYIGGTESVYETDTMCGIGVSYKGGAWYCSMYVLEPH